MSNGDDSGALSRTSGFLGGLLGAQNREMASEDEDKKAAKQALQKMRGRIPGAQVHALIPQWNPANDLDDSASSSLVAGAGRAPLQTERLKHDAIENARNRATQMAIAKLKEPGGKYDRRYALSLAEDALKRAGLDASDPEGASLYENTFNLYGQGFGRPYEPLFKMPAENSGGFFSAPPKAEWLDPGLRAGPPPAMAAPAAKSRPAAPAAGAAPPPAGGWSVRPKT